MANEHTIADLLEFLAHTGERGLMPAATAQALAVAVRNVFAVLDEEEQTDIRSLDLDQAIRRFNNKRARDFSPTSLKEYGRRVRRAVDLYTQWRQNPADFAVKTRTPSNSRDRFSKKDVAAQASIATSNPSDLGPSMMSAGGYQSAFPVRPGRVVTLLNVPEDLTASEAERLAQFIRMLAVQ